MGPVTDADAGGREEPETRRCRYGLARVLSKSCGMSIALEEGKPALLERVDDPRQPYCPPAVLLPETGDDQSVAVWEDALALGY